MWKVIVLVMVVGLAVFFITTVNDGTAALGISNSRRSGEMPIQNSCVGSQCIVQLRRDYLGFAADPMNIPLRGISQPERCSVAGKLVRFDVDWIVLENKDEELWIPFKNVLMIEFGK